MKEKNIVNTDEFENPFKSKGFKAIVKSVIAILVVVVVIFTSFNLFSFVVNKLPESKANSLMTNMLLGILPESITVEDGKEYVFYVEKNKDYNPEENDNAADTLSFYMLDSNGEKEYIQSGVVQTINGNNIILPISFMAQVILNINKVKPIVSGICIVLSILAAVLIFRIAYYIWLYFELKNDAKNNKGNNQTNLKM